ncbi:hypothetical protein BJ944DRAFT_263618 [Cunninghamella echinulata]|nr:hypothetical protein BJ944DRAFT_263618 [Cunninghamella echinulata]
MVPFLLFHLLLLMLYSAFDNHFYHFFLFLFHINIELFNVIFYAVDFYYLHMCICYLIRRVWRSCNIEYVSFIIFCTSEKGSVVSVIF